LNLVPKTYFPDFQGDFIIESDVLFYEYFKRAACTVLNYFMIIPILTDQRGHGALPKHLNSSSS